MFYSIRNSFDLYWHILYTETVLEQIHRKTGHYLSPRGMYTSLCFYTQRGNFTTILKRVDCFNLQIRKQGHREWITCIIKHRQFMNQVTTILTPLQYAHIFRVFFSFYKENNNICSITFARQGNSQIFEKSQYN